MSKDARSTTRDQRYRDAICGIIDARLLESELYLSAANHDGKRRRRCTFTIFASPKIDITLSWTERLRIIMRGQSGPKNFIARWRIRVSRDWQARGTSHISYDEAVALIEKYKKRL